MDKLNKEISRIAKDEIQQIAFPTIVTITKVYDNGDVDVEGGFGLLRKIYSISEHEVGDKTLLVFGDGNYDNMIVI